ncbi:MAG: hypothetical protein AB8F95_08415 [Bacteroidia bacterium]
MNRLLILIWAASSILLSCNKKPPIPHVDIWACHHETTWDAEKVHHTLLGKWEWQFVTCSRTLENLKGDEFEGLEIEFKPDSTLDVIENGEITQTSTWKVVNGDVHLFAVKAEPSVSQLRGRILFCEEKVEFNHGYIDGCDNYFERIE